jgi:hypothetical protein
MKKVHLMDLFVLIGMFLVREFIMIDITHNKYDINFSKEDLEPNITRLTNQVWKLIPMLENKEDWEKQLDTVILEVAGLSEIFLKDPQFL